MLQKILRRPVFFTSWKRQKISDLLTFLGDKELDLHNICDALRDLVPFEQFKKHEKHPLRRVIFYYGRQKRNTQGNMLLLFIQPYNLFISNMKFPCSLKTKKRFSIFKGYESLSGILLPFERGESLAFLIILLKGGACFVFFRWTGYKEGG